MGALHPRQADLANDEVKRYSRHVIMPEVGMEGQRRLKASSVLLIGTGGLGSPLALYLAAAGIGRIGLVDYDVVDFTNLQRQVIHGVSTVGVSKLESAAERMLDLNPDIQVVKYNEPLTSENALRIFGEDWDIVIDGTDNFPTRYLVNDACVKLGPAQTSMAASFASRASSVSFTPSRVPATAACSRSRRRPAWCRAALKAVYWGFCRAPSAPCKLPRRSNCCWASATP